MDIVCSTVCIVFSRFHRYQNHFFYSSSSICHFFLTASLAIFIEFRLFYSFFCRFTFLPASPRNKKALIAIQFALWKTFKAIYFHKRVIFFLTFSPIVSFFSCSEFTCSGYLLFTIFVSFSFIPLEIHWWKRMASMYSVHQPLSGKRNRRVAGTNLSAFDEKINYICKYVNHTPLKALHKIKPMMIRWAKGTDTYFLITWAL